MAVEIGRWERRSVGKRSELLERSLVSVIRLGQPRKATPAAASFGCRPICFADREITLVKAVSRLHKNCELLATPSGVLVQTVSLM